MSVAGNSGPPSTLLAYRPFGLLSALMVRLRRSRRTSERTSATPDTAGAERRGSADASAPFPIRVLTFTALFPNAVQPTHGVFVENRLHHLIASARVSARVIAPIPWFPRALGFWWRRHGELTQAPTVETKRGIVIYHPRYPVVPKIGMTLAPFLLFAWTLGLVNKLRRTGEDFDLIDAHYFYPDGVAAVLIGRLIRKPVVITARGTDINLIPEYALPRRLILFAARNAAGIIAVSLSLKERLAALGVAPARIRVLRNGVDLDMFRPKDRTAIRASLGLKAPTLISVGLLIDRKGHDLVIGALKNLSNYTLIIVGEGPKRSALGRLAAALGVAERVRFLGRVAHERLADLYNAADALVLASSREGWANVLLEAMACGTPVVASNIWGNPEVVTRREAGVLMSERTVEGVSEGVQRLFSDLPDRLATRRYAEEFSWDDTTQGQIDLFTKILAGKDNESTPRL